MKSSIQIKSNQIGDRFLLAVCLALLAGTARGQVFVGSSSVGTIGKYEINGTTLNASLISGLNGPMALAVDGTSLFVANYGAGTIGEYYEYNGTTVNASLISGLNGPAALAVDGTSLFVANYGSGTIGEYATDGERLNASLISGLNGPAALAVDGTSLFVLVEVPEPASWILDALGLALLLFCYRMKRLGFPRIGEFH